MAPFVLGGRHVGQTRDVARYLSLDWIEQMSAQIAANEALQHLSSTHEIGISQVVTDGPEGSVAYHLQVGSGTVSFEPGRADPEHVCMEQSWETAVAVATGALNAQEAFVNGKIRFAGDQERLLSAGPVFAELDRAFAAVRETTTYE